jgi:tetraacyldisaccharide 4'-kinase
LILTVASGVYGAAASWRRRWYAGDPSRVRRLRRPVVSVGNLSVGGSGKTPVVAYLARLLLEAGEHPSILTRGYARRAPRDGVTVVSDPARVLASVEAAGDEPLMLARALPGVPVLAGGNRFLSGRLSEARFGTTVHLLDDGFQHMMLRRDVDLLLVNEDDLRDGVIPAGRLREPLSAASCADAVLVTQEVRLPPSRAKRDSAFAEATADRRSLGGGWSASLAEAFGKGGKPDPTAVRTSGGGVPAPFAHESSGEGCQADLHRPADIGRRLGVPTTFAVTRAIDGPPHTGHDVPVFAVAGIARPERFFGDLSAAGWQVAGSLAFQDHHAFGPRDVERIVTEARACGAALLVTTEKDAVRLEGLDVAGMAVRAVPLSVSVEPSAAFRDWLLARVQRP